MGVLKAFKTQSGLKNQSKVSILDCNVFATGANMNQHFTDLNLIKRSVGDLIAATLAKCSVVGQQSDKGANTGTLKNAN